MPVRHTRSRSSRQEEREHKVYATPEQCVQKVLRAVGTEIGRLKQYLEKRRLIESTLTEFEILRHVFLTLLGWIDCE